MSDTTIAISSDLRDKLAERKQQGESYENVIRRLLGEDSGQRWTEQEIEQIAERVVAREARR